MYCLGGDVMNYALKQKAEHRKAYAFAAPATRQRCWQRLLGINLLNLYRILEQAGEYDMLQWLENIQEDDYVVEVSSLPCPHRDRDRVGRVISISAEAVLIETDCGQRIKWENGTLLKIPEAIMY